MKNILGKLVLLAAVSMITISCGSKANDKPSNNDLKPVIGTTEVTLITSVSATFNVTVTSPGSSSITEQGMETDGVRTKAITTTSSGFTSVVSGLNSNTDITTKPYAINSVGISYGVPVTFKTKPASPLMYDNDGNAYKTITNGTQTWMAEDLKTTKYRDGSAIPLITTDNSWNLLTSSGGRRIYNGNTLYNWFAANDSKNIAPPGWHIPTAAEWSILQATNGGTVLAGSNLKEVGTAHWPAPNAYATNSSGFTGLPNGYCDYFGVCAGSGTEARYITSDVDGTVNLISDAISLRIGIIGLNFGKRGGGSIRLVKD